jgi:NitT/TauT family transport system permease protein
MAVAIPLAILLSMSRLLDRTLYPLIVGFQTVPVVSVAPILLAWFGFGLLPKVIVVVMISFFPIMVNTYAGMKAISEQIENLARSMGATRLQLLWHFQLPGALPAMFAGMKVAITLAVIGAIVAEFVGSDSGLGYEIMVAGSDLDLAHQFAAVAILTGLGLGLFSLMVWVERLCLPWHVSMRPSRKF